MKLENRKFKRTILQITIFGSMGISGLTGALYSHSNPNAYVVIENLEAETKAHGGYAEFVTDNMVLENHPCHIGTSDEGSVEDRIIRYAEKYNLPDEVTDAAIVKFKLYYDNEYEKAESINLKNIYKKIKKQERENKQDLSI